MSTELRDQKLTQKLAKVGKAMKPIGEHTVRVSLVALIVLVALLETDQIWGGTVYSAWQWIWNTLLGYKTVTFGLGMLTCYLLMRHQKVKRESGVHYRVLNKTPLKLDLRALEESAKSMGIELHLTDDPRIMKMNKGLPMDDDEKGGKK